ncbi:MAG: cytochrome c4 [Betaproteobacteria bacterium]|nr:cytochrome c4 [Betaproteobacteria bacterium]
MRHRHDLVSLLVTFLASALYAVTGQAAGDPAKGQAASAMCGACHGPDGNSMIPANPKLAGQHAAHIAKQLKDFKSGARKNPIMAPMAVALSDDDMNHIGAYFAGQKPQAGAARDAASVELGRKLFRGGNASRGIAACSGCHLPNGAGMPSQYPRLAGQHADYTVAQLKAFRSGERNNDPAAVMRTLAANLTDAEIESLAQYVAGLK